MYFTAIVDKLEYCFSVEWGDTLRIRDIYSPYIDLDIHVSQPDYIRLPNLKQIKLFSFDMLYPDVWDQFDEEGFWKESKYGKLTTGSILHVSGPVHCRLRSNISPMFGSYDYIMLNPSLYGKQLDVNGNWSTDITEWLVEKDTLSDETEVGRASRLVVAWECAWQIKEKTHMSNPYNWSRFYEALCQHGPKLLVGIDEGMREIIEINATSSDMFWSEGLEACLAEGAAGGSLRDGALSALGLWRENVLDALDANFGIELDWDLVWMDDTSPLIDELVEAASPG